MPFVGHSWLVLLLLLIIVLIIVGPGKLSQLGGALGKTVRDFRKGASDSADANSGVQSQPPK